MHRSVLLGVLVFLSLVFVTNALGGYSLFQPRQFLTDMSGRGFINSYNLGKRAALPSAKPCHDISLCGVDSSGVPRLRTHTLANNLGFCKKKIVVFLHTIFETMFHGSHGH
jgi:hypothetical protein